MHFFLNWKSWEVLLEKPENNASSFVIFKNNVTFLTEAPILHALTACEFHNSVLDTAFRVK